MVHQSSSDKSKGSSFERLVSNGKSAREVRVGQSYILRKKGQMDNTSQALSRLNRSGNREIPRHFIPLTGNTDSRHVPHALQARQPTHPRSSIRLFCLAEGGQLSQLSWLHFSPTWKVTSEGSHKTSFLPMGVQAKCRVSSSGRGSHEPTHSIKPAGPPLLHGRQRADPIHSDTSRNFCSDHKGAAQANCQRRIRPLEKRDRKRDSIPTAGGHTK